MYLCWVVTRSLRETLELDLRNFCFLNRLYCLYNDNVASFFLFVGQREHSQISEMYLALSRKFQVRHCQQLPAVKIYKMQSSRLLPVPQQKFVAKTLWCCQGRQRELVC